MKLIVGTLMALALASPVAAQEYLHSDEPLFTMADDPWPRHFFEDDGFGCASIVPMGVWRRVDAPGGNPQADELSNVNRLRFRNYGAFHCAYLIDWSESDEADDWRDFDYGLIGGLGQVDEPDGKLDLYAIQSGFRPGSNYLLVAVRPTKGLITQIIVLEPECPREWVRGKKPYDVWRADYCAVPDLAGLRRLARADARKPPAALLEYVPTEDDREGDD